MTQEVRLRAIGRFAAAWVAVTALGFGQLFAQDAETEAYVRSLIAAFRSDSQRVREASVFSLMAIGDPAVPFLIQAIDDPVAQVRLYSIETLRQVRPPAKGAISAIARALRDRSMDVRTAAAGALKHFGTDARDVAPELRECLNSLRGKDDFDENHLLIKVAEALVVVDSPAADVVPHVVPLLRTSGYFQSRTLDLLATMGNAASSSGPAITPLLRSDDAMTRAQAAFTLGRVGYQSREVEEGLLQLSREVDPRVRVAAIEALGGVDGRSQAVIEFLARALSDRRPETRLAAARSLEMLGTSALSALEELIHATQDTIPEVRLRSALAIDSIGPAATRAIPALVALLRQRGSDGAAAQQALRGVGGRALPQLLDATLEPSGVLRIRVIQLLQELGPPTDAVPALVLFLRDQGEIGSAAELALRKAGMRAREPLLEAAHDTAVATRVRSVRLLKELELSEEALTALSKLVRDGAVRRDIEVILRRAGSAAVPHLIRVARTDTAYLTRLVVIAILDSLGPRAAQAAPVLGELLSSDYVGDEAAHALVRIGKRSVPVLIEATASASPWARERAARSLGELRAREGIPAIARLLDDHLAGEAARRALARIGAEGRQVILGRLRAAPSSAATVAALESLGVSVVPELLAALRDSSPVVRRNAVLSLSSIRPVPDPARSAVIEALADPSDTVGLAAVDALVSLGSGSLPILKTGVTHRNPEVRHRAVLGLWKLRAFDDSTRQLLVQATSDSEATVRGMAATALAFFPQFNADVIRGPLLDGLSLADTAARHAAAEALRVLATGYQDERRVERLADVRRIEGALDASRDPEVFKHKLEVARAVAALQTLWWENVRQRAIAWIMAHVVGVAVVAVVLVLLLLWSTLLALKPIWILEINNVLRPIPAVTLSFLGGIRLSIANLILVGLFEHHTRVLDAWVDRDLPFAKRRFAERPTVRERAIHIPIPLSVDGVVIASPTAADLRSHFQRERNLILVAGEGGAGKTSLACQLAWWAMDDVDSHRLLGDHRAIPLLIEHDLDPHAARRDVLHEAIQAQLAAVTETSTELPQRFVAALLRKKRILVIVDHLSEMSEETRAAVRLDRPQLAMRALVITSRKIEHLQGAPRTTIEPLRIKGERLSSFMEAYLTMRGKRILFEDSEYFEYCLRLSEMIGDRDATVLLAKLYAEQMIASKEGENRGLPETVPDLILAYLNELNRLRPAGAPSDVELHRVAKIVAWECIRRTFRPMAGERQSLVGELGGEVHADRFLTYMQDNLRLIKITGPAQNEVRFALDPVAEYLGALFAVETAGHDEAAWQQLFRDCEAVEGSPHEIKGFLQALYDCARAHGERLRVPDWVAAESARRAALDVEVQKRAVVRQRVRRLRRELNRTDPQDQLIALTFLQRLGQDAREAIPDLELLSHSDSEEVRTGAINALAVVRPEPN